MGTKLGSFFFAFAIFLLPRRHHWAVALALFLPLLWTLATIDAHDRKTEKLDRQIEKLEDEYRGQHSINRACLERHQEAIAKLKQDHKLQLEQRHAPIIADETVCSRVHYEDRDRDEVAELEIKELKDIISALQQENPRQEAEVDQRSPSATPQSRPTTWRSLGKKTMQEEPPIPVAAENAPYTSVHHEVRDALRLAFEREIEDLKDTILKLRQEKAHPPVAFTTGTSRTRVHYEGSYDQESEREKEELRKTILKLQHEKPQYEQAHAPVASATAEIPCTRVHYEGGRDEVTERENKELKEANADLRAQISQMHRRECLWKNRVERREIRAEKFQQDAINLQGTLAKHQRGGAQTIIDGLLDKVVDLQTTILKLQQPPVTACDRVHYEDRGTEKVIKKNQELKTFNDDLLDQVAKLQATIFKLQQEQPPRETICYRVHYEDPGSETDIKTNQELKAFNDKLLEQVVQLEVTIRKLQQENPPVAAETPCTRAHCEDHETASDIQTNKELKNANADLRDRVTQLQDQEGWRQERIGMIQQQRNALRTQLTDLLKRESLCQQRIHTMQQEKTSLRTQLTSLEHKTAEYKAMILKLQQERPAFAGETPCNRVHYEDRDQITEAKCKTFKDTNTDLLERVVRLQRREGMLQYRYDLIEQKKNALQTQLGCLNDQAADWKHDAIKYKNQVDKYEGAWRREVDKRRSKV